MNERDALTVLDRRMTAASADLRRAVDETLGSRPATGPTAAAIGNGGAGAGPTSPIKLERATAPSRSRRWVWAAAAAVIALVGVAGLVMVDRGKDKSTPPANPGPQPFLVPGWLPPEWGPKSAA